MPKDAYYFSHDANAAEDPKIKQLLAVYGYEGYGWFWRLVEIMRSQEGYELNLTGKYVFHGLAEILKTTPEKAQAFIQDCIDEFDLFSRNDTAFWSESLKRRMERLENTRSLRKTSGKKGAEVRWADKEPKLINGKAIATPCQTDSMAIAKNSKVKESKVKESIKEIYKEKLSEKKPHGEFQNVLLTDGEKSKLVARFGEAGAGDKIEELSEALKSRAGYAQKYTDHYATILAWARKHAKEAPVHTPPAGRRGPWGMA